MGFDLTGLGSVADLAKGLVDRFFPNKSDEEKAQLALTLAAMQNQAQMNQSQAEVNKVEAAGDSLFKSGWRPFVGWTCALACCWNWVALPVVKVVLILAHQDTSQLLPGDLSQMFPLLLGLLGMTAFRTYEKTQGVASK
jgi:hypothetical protein